MLPEYDPLAGLMSELGDPEQDAIPIDKLEVFNDMTTQGTEKAAQNVEMMTGIETTAEVTQISFAAIEDVPRQIGTETYVGTVVEFTGTPAATSWCCSTKCRRGTSPTRSCRQTLRGRN